MAKNISGVKVASTFSDQLVGLIGNPHQRMLFKTRFGIHTFFMKESIDVVVISEKGQVISLKEGLKPWKVYFWNPKYNQVLELPRGFIQKLKIKKGDLLQVTDEIHK